MVRRISKATVLFWVLFGLLTQGRKEHKCGLSFDECLREFSLAKNRKEEGYGSIFIEEGKEVKVRIIYNICKWQV